MSEARRTDLRDAGNVLCVPLCFVIQFFSFFFFFSLVMFAYANCTQISKKKKITKRFTNAKCKKKMPFLWGLDFVCFLHGTAAFFSSAKSSDGGPAVKEYYGLKNEKGKKKEKKWVVLKSVVFCATSASTQRARKNASGLPHARKQSITRSTVYQKSDCDKVKDVMPISKVQSVYATTTKRTDLELGPSPSVTLNSVPLPWRDVWYLRRRVCVRRHAGGPFRSFCVFVASLAFPSQGLRPARVSWVLRQKPCCRFKTNKKRTYLMGLWWWWRGERTSREEGPAFIMSMCVCERRRIERECCCQTYYYTDEEVPLNEASRKAPHGYIIRMRSILFRTTCLK